jgi:Leucine-rich repeat (LRR) protein
MQSYFDACSDSIKPCIFYLSIFSAEKNIRLRRLLWRWIAEGYCRDTSDGTTCEENWEKFVSELVKLSIIQESASSKVFCQINGFFHEYIISRKMEDNLVFALEGRCSLNSQRAGQHLTIRSNWDRNEIVYESIDFSRLRSLTVFGKWESFFICSKKVNMRLLRVLDLEDATDVTNEDLDKIAKLLTRLKFLSLRGCREITRLPISMGGLRQLQTLDIRGTSIVTLPLFVTKLQKVRYIRAGTTEVCDWEGDIVAADGEEDRASAAAEEEGDVVSADGEEGDRASSSAQAVTNLPAVAATPKESPVLPAEPGSSVSCNNKPHTLVSSLLSKLCRRSGALDDNNGPTAAGVTVPADIGKLVVLHTLGVVKVNAQCGNKAIFQELKKLTQLRKLGVSGINKGNIKEFCEAISHHAHLKSLSVELDKDDGLDDNIPEPPKTIQSLKLYGRVHKLLLVWMEHLNNLEKLHLTIEKSEELRDLPELWNEPRIRHLRIRPIQDGELRIGPGWINTWVVEIQCSSVLHIKFDYPGLWWNVGLLKVHFSGGSQSSLQISRLSNLKTLKEVWLKGYTDAHKQDMQRQIDGMELGPYEKRPVLKLVRPPSS